MRRLFVVAAIVAVLSVVPLFGQMRSGRAGASFGRGFSSHSFGSVRGGFGVNRGSFGRGGSFGFNRGGFGFNHGGGFFPGRGRFVGRGFYGRSPIFLGGSFYWGPDYYDGYYAYPYACAPPVVSAPPTYYYPDEYYERGDLRRDIDALNGKVDHLQRDVEARTYVPRPPTRQEAARQSTTLVFKDKHREEVQNYAVVGGTLWILDEKKASKVPLEDIDVDATTRLNDERGVDFDVPR